MTAIAILNALADQRKREKHPTVPYLVRSSYKDRTANELTRCITDFIKFNGGMATRIQSQGQYRPGIGGRRGTYTFGTTRKGTADIHAVCFSKHLSIEVKIGKDRQSADQKIMQADVERAGGIYIIARSFQEFYDWYQQTFLPTIMLP